MNIWGGGGGGGMNILWIIFWDHHKTGLYLGVISMHLGSFLNVKVQNGRYFLGLVKFQIFLGCLKFLILIWGVNDRCRA